MESDTVKSVSVKVGGMVCVGCQEKIESGIKGLSGIKKISADWKNGQVKIEFDESKIAFKKIKSEIEKLGYKVISDTKNAFKKIEPFLYILIIAVLFLILQKTGALNLLVPSALASSKMSFALLFLTGILTSVHCIAMCGGINLTQSLAGIQRKSLLPPLFYNLGRLVSYTAVGFALGAAGFFFWRRQKCGNSSWRSRNFENRCGNFYAFCRNFSFGDFSDF